MHIDTAFAKLMLLMLGFIGIDIFGEFLYFSKILSERPEVSDPKIKQSPI